MAFSAFLTKDKYGTNAGLTINAYHSAALELISFLMTHRDIIFTTKGRMEVNYEKNYCVHDYGIIYSGIDRSNRCNSR
jgi:hypothetical protein